MKTKIAFLFTLFCAFSFASQQLSAQDKTTKKQPMDKTQSASEPKVKISTSYGDMVLKLYNETPIHRDNFLKLVNEKFYDGLLFHRVINGFMIQGGDPLSKNATPTQMLGMGDNGYTLPAEFNPALKHKKGALAAARTNNPEKRSSGCQFYIVQNQNGTPQLDMSYTVFGEVISGFDVIDKIAAVKTQPGDRPVEDVRMTITLVK